MNYPVHARTARDTIANPFGLIQFAFLRSSTEHLREALSKDSADLASIKQELALLANGRLHIHEKNGRYYFGSQIEESSRETGISGDPARIHELARRHYLEQKAAAVEQNTRRLKRVLSSFDTACYESSLHAKLKRYASAGLDLTRILFSKEQNDWIDEPYTPNPHYKDSLRYKTAHGIPVRSKSESMLGSFFETVGLPFRSDDFVDIHTEYGDHPFRESYFADFKIPNLCGGITIHEHLGAMHLDDYPDNSLKRLNDYHNFTVFELPGRPVKPAEFTWSFEPDICSKDMLYQLTRRMLLPTIL